MKRSFWQRLFAPETADGKPGAVETESRSWMVRCPACGYEISIWDLGGVRYKAKSKGKRLLRRCRQCGKIGCHRVYKKRAAPSVNESAP